jgi:hypothetical protein
MPDPALSPRFLGFPRSLRNHYGDALLLGEGLGVGLELLGDGDGDDVVPGSTKIVTDPPTSTALPVRGVDFQTVPGVVPGGPGSIWVW